MKKMFETKTKEKDCKKEIAMPIKKEPCPSRLSELFRTVESRSVSPEKPEEKKGTLAGLVEHRLLNW